MKILSLIIWFIATTPFPSTVENKHELRIDIENIKEKEGELIIAIFDCKENFLKKDVYNQSVSVTGSTSMNIKVKLPEGEYSIAIFHDTNNNGELDKNIFGWPQEAFGFSNKSMGLIGPPSYNDTKFDLKGATEVKVKLKHL